MNIFMLIGIVSAILLILWIVTNLFVWIDEEFFKSIAIILCIIALVAFTVAFYLKGLNESESLKQLIENIKIIRVL